MRMKKLRVHIEIEFKPYGSHIEYNIRIKLRTS